MGLPEALNFATPERLNFHQKHKLTVTFSCGAKPVTRDEVMGIDIEDEIHNIKLAHMKICITPSCVATPSSIPL